MASEKQIYKITEFDIRNMVSEVILLLENTTPRKWTYDKCYAEAQKYNNLTKFRKESREAYRTSIHNTTDDGKLWIDTFTWLERKKVNDEPVYIVYSYYDDETNTVYVGLTEDLKRRHKEHHYGIIHSKGKIRFDTVYKHFNAQNKEVPEPIVLETGLYDYEAQIYEDLYIEDCKNKGFNVINICKAGSLGGASNGPTKWNYENCYKLAQKYKSRSDFARENRWAYDVAKNNRWLDDYTWLEKKEHKYSHWQNYENCYNEAKKYKTRHDFWKFSNQAYATARKNKWLDDYTWFEEVNKPKGYWDNYNNCYNEAKKYKSRTEFSKNQPAYKAACKNGWLDDYTWFEKKQKPTGYWNDYDNCYNEAKKYSSKIEFRNGSSGAYQVASRNGWLDDYTWLEKRNALPKNYWTYDRCKKEAQQYKSRNNFRDGSRSAYEASFRNGWLDEWFPIEATKAERCYNEAKKYKSREEFKLNSPELYKYAKNQNLLKNYTWLEKMNVPNGYWENYDNCYDAAKKYKTRTEFYKKNNLAYQTARINGWLDKWFPKEMSKTERCNNEAKKYKSREEFRLNSPEWYKFASYNNRLKNYPWLK